MQENRTIQQIKSRIEAQNMILKYVLHTIFRYCQIYNWAEGVEAVSNQN